MKLKNKATLNARVTKGKEVLKEGVPCDHTRKHIVEASVVGVNIGATLNKGDYESLRVDVWLTDTVQENEDFNSAYGRVTKVVDETLQEIVSKYK